MKSFKVSLSESTHPYEPNPAYMESMKDYIADSQYKKEFQADDIKTFVEMVGERGRVFCPSTFKYDLIHKNNFEQSQLFALYFDIKSSNQNETVKNILERAIMYHIIPLFVYDAYSNKSRTKFCFVFLHDTPVTDYMEAKAIYSALMAMFPEAAGDQGILSVFKGGRELYIYYERHPTFGTESLMMNLCLYLKDRHGATNYKKKVIDFCKKNQIALSSRNLPELFLRSCGAEDSKDISENLSEYTFAMSDSECMEKYKNSTKSTNKSALAEKLYSGNDYLNQSALEKAEEKTDKNESSLGPSRSNNQYGAHILPLLGSSCRLYQEFESGTKKIRYQELLGIASNILQVRTGPKYFKKKLRDNLYFEKRPDEYHNWEYYLYFMKNIGAWKCEKFCPYCAECEHAENLLVTNRPKYHEIVKISNDDGSLVTLDETHDDFQKKFASAVASNEDCWHIIKSPTAIGKTESVLNLIAEHPEMKILVAVPTNDLKREYAERAKKKGIELAVSPSLHEIKDDLDDFSWGCILQSYETGKSPMPYIHQCIDEGNTICAQLFGNYIKEMDDFTNSECSAVTTHRRLSSLDLYKYDLVIIDEDYLYSSVIPNKAAVSAQDLKKLLKKLPASDTLAGKIKKILKDYKKKNFFELGQIKYKPRKYADIKMPVNISALCSAQYFCHCPADMDNSTDADSICFMIPVHLPQDLKYIMLSATADENICNYYFGKDNVKFYETREAKLTGTLNQYADRSMSRSYMKQNTDCIQKIKRYTGVENTISFKMYDSYNTDGLHYGNCAGSDVLKGKDIDIIGTPHQPEWIYKLFAFSLGFPVDAELQPGRTVTHNGFRFRFTTYDDEVLRNIQFYIIETELVQAVGRARLLRCECKVNLFSNFPLRQAALMASEYENVEIRDMSDD